MLEKKASGTYVPTTHDGRSGVIEHFSVSFRQRRTFVVSAAFLLISLIAETLLGYNFIINQIQLYSFLILLAFDVVLSALVGWLTAEPLAILAYLRAVRREQQTDSRVYTALAAVQNLYETPSSPSHQLEQKDIRAIAREVHTHLMILGLPGAGKTMALRAAYQFPTFKRYWSLIRGQQSIPVYIPLKDYNAFLGKTNVAVNQSVNVQNQLVGPLAYPEFILAYLLGDNGLVGLNHLRPYMQRLAERGRLFFLCDGLNEVDRNRLEFVCHELMRTMQGKLCRLAMTCRELDYREEPVLHRLVGTDYAEVALILPLRLDQIESFVEQYRKYAPEQIGRQNKYSASEINQRIKQSRLSYNCTNPMMLVTLMQTIDELDNDALNIGTRGLLLSKYISRLVIAELQRQGERSITEGDVVLFLSQLAFTARRYKLRNTIQLGRVGATSGGAIPRTMSIPELAAKLQLWLDEHALPEIDMTGQYALQPQVQRGYIIQDIEQLTLFTQGAGLITISYHGVLSFRHELIAEYFAANYLYVIDVNPQAPIPFGNELVADIGAWSEPIAMWAGMSQNPMELAKRIANLAQSYPQHSYNALSLSLVCAGVRWGPQEKNPPPLPDNVSQLLVTAVHDVDQRTRLAQRLKYSADEGGIEVYHALLPLIMEAHIDDLLLMLDKWVVSDLLFDYLRDAVETGMPHEYVKQLVHVLGRFGEVVIPQAIKLSQAGPTNNVYLRVEALCVLAGTNVVQAVEPLIGHLSDTDDQIISATVNALVQLGPTLALDRVLQELKNQVPRVLVPGIHWAALAILRGFLSQHTLNEIQYKRIIGALLQATSSLYIPNIQGEAKRLLEEEAKRQRGERWQRIVEMMIRSLDDRDEARTATVQELLQKTGKGATPLLLAELQRSRMEVVKVNIIAVLGTVCDPDALRPLLPFLDDPFPLVRQQVSIALRDYAPESISPLIDMVLYHQSQKVAESASAILKEIGSASVPRVIDVLDRIVRNRTLLLVDVLAFVHDTQAVRPLIGLLKRLSSEADEPLTLAVIQALGTFPERQVVPPLLEVLLFGTSPFFEEASRVLSSFGQIALPELIAALNVQEETASVRRVRAALLHMQPFLDGQLLDALRTCSDAQARQIELVFLQKDDTAPFLVGHISHTDQRVCTSVLALLDKMEREQVTPPLLDALKNPGELEVIARFLLKYPESIPDLVNLLGDPKRNDAAVMVLLRFGIAVIPYLEPGLNHANAGARLRASTILVRLMQQENEPQMQRKVITQMVELFALARRESHAWYALLDLLTSRFAEKSIPALLQGLEYTELRDGCAEALVRIVLEHDGESQVALDELLAALHMRERMVGATEALVMLDAKAVEQVSKLVLDDDTTVALKAQEILSRIGPAALTFVWENYRNVSDEQLQQVSHKIFYDMLTERIKDELIQLLIGEDRLHIEMAITLILERVLVENEMPLPDQKMIAALLEHVQTYGKENTNLHVIVLLLLLPKDVVIRHLRPVLYTEHQEWLTQIFLLLGPDISKYVTTLNIDISLLESYQTGYKNHDFQQMQRKIIGEMVKLFVVVQRESQVWYALLDLLTNRFAEKSIPTLLQGLEDAEQRDGCAEALVLMVLEHDGESQGILFADDKIEYGRQAIVDAITSHSELLPAHIRDLGSRLTKGTQVEIQLIKGGGMLVGKENELILRVTNCTDTASEQLEIELQPSAEYNILSSNPICIANLDAASSREACFDLRMKIAKQVAVNYKVNGQMQKDALYINAIKDNPYVYGNPIHEEAAFFGRKYELEEIIQAMTKPMKQDILIIGERRTGKTSLLFQLEKRLDRPFIPVYAVLSTSKRRTEDVLSLILRSIIFRLVKLKLLEERWKTHLFPYPDFEDNLNDIIDAARKNLDDVKIVLLLDEADYLLQIGSLLSRIVNLFRKTPQVDERVQSILRAALQSEIGSRLPAVLSSTNNLSTYISQNTSPLHNQFRMVHLKFLSPIETQNLIRTPASMLGYTYAPSVVERIRNLSGGHPYYCQALCYEAFEKALQSKRNIIGEPEMALAEKKIIDNFYNGYLSGFWKRANQMEREYLTQLAHDKPLHNVTRSQIERLLDWQIIIEEQGVYVFSAELFKKWTLMAS